MNSAPSVSAEFVVERQALITQLATVLNRIKIALMLYDACDGRADAGVGVGVVEGVVGSVGCEEGVQATRSKDNTITANKTQSLISLISMPFAHRLIVEYPQCLNRKRELIWVCE